MRVNRQLFGVHTTRNRSAPPPPPPHVQLVATKRGVGRRRAGAGHADGVSVSARTHQQLCDDNDDDDDGGGGGGGGGGWELRGFAALTAS